MLETPVYLTLLRLLRQLSDNVLSADNQQERGVMENVDLLDVSKIHSNIGYYLAGFTDGEGSFNISFRPRQDYKQPWKVSLCFNISQKDKVILALFKTHLKCGTLRSRPDGVWYYEVNNFRAIVSNVIPFFKRFHFLSAKKKRDFLKFAQLARLMQEGQHLTPQGIKKILEIRREMNDGGKRIYGEDEILKRFYQHQSSETTRQTPNLEMI
jgi:hypothetical protein